MTIGERIRKLRKEKGLTQEAISSVLGVSRQAIAKWESDQSSPSTENLIKLANLFDISLEDLVDLKEYQTPALEEYARRKIEEEKKKEERKVFMIQVVKETVLTLIIYTAIYLGSYLIFHLAGVKNYIWNWLNSYHVLLITSLFSIFFNILGQRRIAFTLLIGTILSIIIGNISGGLSIKQSIIGYNTGWIYYLIGICISLIVGCFVEHRILAVEEKASQWRKKYHYAMCVICILFSVSVSFIAASNFKYKAAAECGYQQGYEIGTMAAQNNQSMNPQFLESYYPENYAFGSKEFKGYALYWQEGYEVGYYDVKG